MTSKQIPRNGSDQTTLEEALAECLRVAEADRGADPEALLSRFPHWRNELREFLTDWERMERLSSDLSGQRSALRMRAALGTKIRYLGDYELLQEIGCGGMGIIFKARQISLDRVVALKIILDPRHDRERFRVECEAAASLSHTNIVPIHEVGEFDGHPYFSMQFIDGGNLSDRIAAGPLPPRQAGELIATIARVVHFAHQRGILHRDLKPANVLLDAEGKPFISDFGLAKQVKSDSELTQTGAILGTPGYMAPEQAAGDSENLTVATDIHGLGAVLYATMIGGPPFCGQTTLETLRFVEEQPPRSLRGQRPDVPRDLETICLKCLEKDPQARYASAEAMADDVDRFLRHEPIEARPVGQLERLLRWCRRNPAIAALTTAVACLLVATAAVSVFLANSEYRGRVSAEGLRQIALNTSSDQSTAKGITAGDHGDPHESLLLFSEAARLAQEDPQRLRANLLRFDSWREQVLEPVAVLPLHADVTEIQFDVARPRLLCAARNSSVVWNYETDDLWQLAELLPQITCATLAANDSRLAAGAEDGRVVLADCETREVLRQIDFEQSVKHVTFTPDGKLLAVAAGKSVHLLDCKSMKLQAQLDHRRVVSYVAFNREGDRLITVNNVPRRSRGQLSVFRTGDQEPLFDPIPCVVERNDRWRSAFWPAFVDHDSKLLVKVDREKKAHMFDTVVSEFHVYDLESGQELKDQRVHEPGPYSPRTGGSNALVVSPNTRTVVNCGGRYARLIDIESDRKWSHRKEQLRHRERVTVADFSSDGQLVATGGWDRDLRLWSADQSNALGVVHHDARPLLAVLPHQTRLRHIKFSPDDRLLASVQIDGLVRISRVPDLPLVALRVPGGTRVKLVPSPAQVQLDDDTEASGSSAPRESRSADWMFLIAGWSHKHAAGSKATVHRVSDGAQVGQAVQVDGILMDAELSPLGGQIATINAPPHRNGMFREDGSAGTFRFWTWPDGRPQGDPIPMPAEPRSLVYRPDGKQVAVMCALGQVLLIDPRSGSIERHLMTDTRKLVVTNSPVGHGRVRYAPDGKTLIAWSHGVWAFDISPEAVQRRVIGNSQRRVSGIDISGDGKRLAVARGNALALRIFDLEATDKLPISIPHPSNVFAADFSPDGERVVTACRIGQAAVYEWPTGHSKPVLRGLRHNGDVLRATFTPDGKYLLTAGHDRMLRVWYAHDGRLALRPRLVGFNMRQILVTPDSRYAVVCGRTEDIRTIDLSPLYEEPRTNLAQAAILGELLSNQIVHGGGTVELTTHEWLERWDKFSQQN